MGWPEIVIADRRNPGWWGEKEVKMYIDGDRDHPTIAGTGLRADQDNQ
jgi:DUF2961 family protein